VSAENRQTSGTATSFTAAGTTLDVGSSLFDDTHIGARINFTTSGESYEVVSITDDTTVEVDRAAVSGDETAAFTINEDEGQRFNLLLWPTPDAAYTLHYAKAVQVSRLSPQNYRPIGGMLHGETILASCLAVMQSVMNEPPTYDWKGEYMERLTASVMMDRNITTPEHLGYNSDQSSNTGFFDRFSPVTYQGTQYP